MYEYPREAVLRVLANDPSPPPPVTRSAWLEITDTVFYASMKRDEDHAVRVSVVYDDNGADTIERLPPAHPVTSTERAWHVTRLARQKLTPSLLAKLSRGIVYGKDVLVIGGRSPELHVEGIARRNPLTDGGAVTRLSAPRPGVLVFERGYEELMRFEDGREVMPALDVVNQMGPVRHALAYNNGFGCKLQLRAPEAWITSELLRAMRSTGSGGLLAMLPTEATNAQLARVTYRLADATVLTKRIDASRRFENRAIGMPTEWEPAERFLAKSNAVSAVSDVEETVAMLGRLSAIDGALLLGPRFVAYGAGFIVENVAPTAVYVADDVDAEISTPSSLRHGSRHQAAFAFAHDHPGGVSFVISEDGPIRCAMRIDDKVMCWSVRIPET